MSIDVVHDTQEVFRRLLDCMARPGEVATLGEVADRIEYTVPCFSSTFLVALTVLDSEVSFHVLSDTPQSMEALFTRHTHAKKRSLNEADFIFVTADCPEAVLIDALSQAKKGTLLDPHTSATFVMECASFLDGNSKELQGPGIKDKTLLPLELSSKILSTRQACNTEYPLGVDLILTDDSQKLACLPRTTVVREVH